MAGKKKHTQEKNDTPIQQVPGTDGPMVDAVSGDPAYVPDPDFIANADGEIQENQKPGNQKSDRH